MNHQYRLEITDRDGWQKIFQVEKAIAYIGSDPGDDVFLDRMRGGGVAPRHIQLIAPTATGGAFRLVNLGDGEVTVGAEGSYGARPVAPRSFATIADGETPAAGRFPARVSRQRARRGPARQTAALRRTRPRPTPRPWRALTAPSACGSRCRRVSSW